MDCFDHTIHRNGREVRVFVVNTDGRDYGQVLIDGVEAFRQVLRLAGDQPLALAKSLMPRAESGEFDSLRGASVQVAV